MISLPTFSSEHEIFPQNDFDHPEDTVSCIRWTPDPSLYQFLAGGWDCKIRVYNFQPEERTFRVPTIFEMTDPCLSLAMIDNSKWLCGLITGSINILELDTRACYEINTHTDAVKDIYMMSPETFMSLSYDKVIKTWDTRVQREVGSLKLPEKIYCSDFNHSKMEIALGLSNRKLFVGSIKDLTMSLGRNFHQFIDSPLRKGSQLSSISLSKVDPFIALATSDGKANVSKINATNDLSNVVSFMCHKIDPGQGGNTSPLKIFYPVHAIEFHPTLSHTLFTAGGEGNLNFWDSLRRDRIRTAGLGTIPITKAAFSPDGKYIAYGKGYDWAKGIQGDKSYPNSIGVHEVQHEEVHNDRN